MKTIPKRSEVPAEETWNLDDLFKSFVDWQKHFDALPTAEALKKTLADKYKSKLQKSAAILFECLQFKDTLFRKIENLYVYANLRSTEDVANNEANEFCGKIANKMSELHAEFAFLEPEILKIKELKQWIQTEPLKTYHFKLSELLRLQAHVLSEAEEALLSKLSVPLRTFDDIHSKWNNVDLKFQDALDSKGNKHIVSNSRYSHNLQSFDRTLRANTFLSYYSEIAKWRQTMTANYYGNMISGSSIAKIRGFKTSLDAELFSDDIPVAVYDNLIATVRKNLPHLHKSMELRKKILNIPAVAPYDRYVSLFKGESESSFSWEEGRDLVLKAIEPLGSEYVQIAHTGLTTDRWIDRAENENKRSGAFSWGTYDSRPYMLQSWTGSLHDVYTLAHELGHSMHSYMSHKHQPYHLGSYTIFVAEVASTLNEALLTHYILKNMPNTDLAKSVMSETLGNFEGTVLRQTLFAEFEKQVALTADSGDVYTPDLLESLYFNLTKEWYGSHAEHNDLIKHEWMRIPHFYSSFYVYKYATSYCASLALYKCLMADPEEGRRRIFSLLQAGGSKSSLQILLDAGVDFLDQSNKNPVSLAFEKYHENLEEAARIFIV